MTYRHLPKAAPDQKPIHPRVLDALMKHAHDYKVQRRWARVKAVALVIMLGLSIYAALWTRSIRRKQDMPQPEIVHIPVPQRVPRPKSKAAPQQNNTYAKDKIVQQPKQ